MITITFNSRKWRNTRVLKRTMKREIRFYKKEQDKFGLHTPCIIGLHTSKLKITISRENFF